MSIKDKIDGVLNEKNDESDEVKLDKIGRDLFKLQKKLYRPLNEYLELEQDFLYILDSDKTTPKGQIRAIIEFIDEIETVLFKMKMGAF